MTFDCGLVEYSELRIKINGKTIEQSNLDSLAGIPVLYVSDKMDKDRDGYAINTVTGRSITLRKGDYFVKSIKTVRAYCDTGYVKMLLVVDPKGRELAIPEHTTNRGSSKLRFERRY